jgi:hypothetical protein
VMLLFLNLNLIYTLSCGDHRLAIGSLSNFLNTTMSCLLNFLTFAIRIIFHVNFYNIIVPKFY